MLVSHCTARTSEMTSAVWDDNHSMTCPDYSEVTAPVSPRVPGDHITTCEGGPRDTWWPTGGSIGLSASRPLSSLVTWSSLPSRQTTYSHWWYYHITYHADGWWWFYNSVETVKFMGERVMIDTGILFVLKYFPEIFCQLSAVLRGDNQPWGHRCSFSFLWPTVRQQGITCLPDHQ